MIGKIVMVMVAYFLVSIVTSMAQSYRKKMQQKENNSWCDIFQDFVTFDAIKLMYKSWTQLN